MLFRGKARVLNIRPWLAVTLVSLTVLFVTTYVGAAAYIIFRDELLGAAVSRQVEMQYAYEERIATLRAELDRVTSRHIVQSEGLEQQLATLLSRQELIDHRQSVLDGLVSKARASGIEVAMAEARLPRPRPASEAEAASSGDTAISALGYLPEGAASTADQAILNALLTRGAEGEPNSALRSTFSRVQSSLDDTQARQGQALSVLGATVEAESERLTKALVPLGIQVERSDDDSAEPQGGPFVPTGALHFVERAAELDRTLSELSLMRRSAAAMPVAAPLKVMRISSGFGSRIDPFLKKRAFHSGLDFVAPKGTIVHATAPGEVVSTGRKGGYGIMVEIRHANGISTRYGHLSKALVTPGTIVSVGTPIGRVGSTGRSTGPHLHYETRRNGKAVNPAVFVRAGRILGGA